MIIQGSNQPITIQFSEPVQDLKNISVTLTDMCGHKIHWKINNLVIENDLVYAPLSQRETSELSQGICQIDVKWVDVDGMTQFSETQHDNIVGRQDKTFIMDGAV